MLCTANFKSTKAQNKITKRANQETVDKQIKKQINISYIY